MAEYTFNNWVNNTSSNTYLGFSDNTPKLTTTQFSLSDDAFSKSAKIIWFNEVPADEQVAPRTFRFGSSYFLYITTTIPAGTFVGWSATDRWYVHSWTESDLDGDSFGNQDTYFAVPGDHRLTPTAPDDLILNFTDPALTRMQDSRFALQNTFVYGESDEARKLRLRLLGYI